MKGFLKHLLQIIWPFLGALFIWLFFFTDESDNVIYLVFGFVLIGIFLGLLPLIYKKNSFYTLLGKIGIGLAVCSIFIPCIICVLMTIFHVAKSHQLLVLFAIVFLIIAFICYIIIRYKIKKNMNMALFPAMRFMMMFFALSSALCFVAISTIGFIDSIIHDYEPIYILGKWESNIALVSIISILFLGCPAMYIVWGLIRDCHFFVYEKDNFTLYLRSFQFDKDKGTRNILKILNGSG